MDPVQNDLNLLGIKQAYHDGYNIHIPPLPREGKYHGLKAIIISV